MDNSQNQLKPKRTFRLVLGILILVGFLGGAFLGYLFFLKPNVPSILTDEYVEIPTGSNLEDVIRILKEGNFISDVSSFSLMAGRLKYRGRAGRFKITPGMSSFRLVRHLRGGAQSPVKVVLVNERLPEDIAGKAGKYIEADSMALVTQFYDPVFLDSAGLDSNTLLSLFIPNTYELYWNTSARKFLDRMLKENSAFWQKENRLSKAAALGLTKEQVYTLASIVERETNVEAEKARIAGVYLNRLKINMPLQADPTLVFASRDWEARDLAKYKALNSPYNTYMYAGLPPGPISMSSIPTIDAVLNAEKHDYLFFVSLGDGTGKHLFAVTYDAHKVNIETYKKNLISRNLGL